MTLKTLFDIVEKGLGGKVNISIQLWWLRKPSAHLKTFNNLALLSMFD
jgi:hypothetical protein